MNKYILNTDMLITVFLIFDDVAHGAQKTQPLVQMPVLRHVSETWEEASPSCVVQICSVCYF